MVDLAAQQSETISQIYLFCGPLLCLWINLCVLFVLFKDSLTIILLLQQPNNTDNGNDNDNKNNFLPYKVVCF